MIVSFRDERTKELAERKRVKAFSGFGRKAELKLDQLEAATSLLDLSLPGNRLEAVKGDRQGQYNIRIKTDGGYALSGPKEARDRSMLKLSTIIEVNYGTHCDTSRRTSGRAA